MEFASKSNGRYAAVSAAASAAECIPTFTSVSTFHPIVRFVATAGTFLAIVVFIFVLMIYDGQPNGSAAVRFQQTSSDDSSTFSAARNSEAMEAAETLRNVSAELNRKTTSAIPATKTALKFASRINRKTKPPMRSMAEIQAERHKLLAEQCGFKSATDRPTGQSIIPEFNMFADEDLGYFFCLVPKVACTNWKITLAKAGGKRNPTRKFVHGNPRFSRFVSSYQRFSADERKEIMEHAYKFMFARHPFERLVSAYRDKISGLSKRDRGYEGFVKLIKRIRRKYANDKSGRPNFEAFVDYVLQPDRPFNRHWDLQSGLCKPCQIPYDFIGHYETLDADVRYVLAKLDVGDKVSFPEGNSHNSSALVESMFAALPEKKVQKLLTFYKRDFELFGYKWPRSEEMR